MMSSRIKSAAVITSLVSALIAGGITSAQTATASTTTLGYRAVAIAKKQLKKPYVWGASGPNAFDCSGLVYYSFRKAGKLWKRTTAQAQYNISRHINGKNRTVGDLVFFGKSSHSIVHVGIYVGNGNMIDADSGHYYKHRVTVEPVKGWFSQHYHVYYGRLA